MSKKTKTLKRHYKKHKNKKTYRKHKNKKTYRKRFKKINNRTGTEKVTGRGIQLFTEPTKIHSQSILIDQTQIQSGNMIPGLRNM
jgi:hypothetical protein